MRLQFLAPAIIAGLMALTTSVVKTMIKLSLKLQMMPTKILL